MSARGRLGLGAFFAVIGVAAWTALFVPLGSRYEIGLPFGDTSDPPYTAYMTLRWEDLERSLRLAALALGVGGLLLMARGWRRGVGLSLGLGLLWFLAEVLVELVEVRWAYVVIAGAALGLLVAVTAWRCHRNVVTELARPAWSLLVYGVGAFAFAPALVYLRVLADLQGQLPWAVVVLTVLVPACALVAAAAAWPGPVRAPLLAGVLAVAGVAGWAWHAWYPLEVSFDSPQWTTRDLGLLGGTALLGAACVALTGAFGRGRWVAARVAGLVAVLLCLGAGAGTAIVALVPVDHLELVQKLPALPRLVTALTVGAAALAATRLLLGAPSAAVEPPAAGTSPDGRPVGRWRPAAGWLLAGLGVGAWTLMAFVAAPTARGVYWIREGNSVAPFVRDLRWAAIVLAAGGLLLLARTGWSRAALAAATAGWVALDVTVQAVGLQGWPWAATSVVAVFALVARVTAVGATRNPVRPGGTSAIIYSGASGLTAILVVWNAGDSTSPLLPAWVVPASLVLGLLLVVAAVVNALAAAPRVGWERLGFAVGVTLAGGLAATISYRSSIEPGTDRLMQLLTGPAIGLFAVACVLLAGPVRPARGWLVTGSAVLTSVGAVVAVFGGISIAARGLLLFDEGASAAGHHSLTLAGVLGGAAVGLLALLPRALSTPDGPPAAPPVPVPQSAPVSRAPLARSDVPEILDWSARPDRTV